MKDGRLRCGTGETPVFHQTLLLSSSPRKEQAERRAQQQCSRQFFLVPDRYKSSPLGADFENADGECSDSAAAPATLAPSGLDLQSATARPAAKTIGNLGHWNNCFVARDDGFSENTLDLGAGGKALVQ